MASSAHSNATTRETPDACVAPALPAALGHIESLDGLRGIAVLIVMAYHGGWFGISGGFIGVDLFFLLSGFLITRLLIDEHTRNGTISMKSFYIRRGLRLLPALLTLVAGVWLAAVLLESTGFREGLGGRTFWALSYLANWNDVFTGTHFGPFSHLWSLSVEEQFYVVWPLVVIAIIGRWGIAAVAHIALGGSIFFAATTAVQSAFGVSQFTLYYGTHSHGAVLLLAGAWLGASPAIVARIDVAFGKRLLSVGLAGLAVLILLPSSYEGWHPQTGYVPVTLMSLALVAGAVGHPRFHPLHIAPLRLAGRLSYGLYLWHIPMFAITMALIPDVNRVIAVGGGSFAAAIVSYVVIEQPAMRLKHRWT